MTFGFTEAWAIPAWGVFVFWQVSNAAGSNKARKRYEKEKSDADFPAWVFPVVWGLLYAALVVGIYFFTRDTPTNSWQIIVGVIVFVIHIIANKLWSLFFWDQNDPETALTTLVIIMLPTAIAWLCASIVGQTHPLYWIPVLCNSLNVGWLLVAMWLNYNWIPKASRTTRQNKGYAER